MFIVREYKNMGQEAIHTFKEIRISHKKDVHKLMDACSSRNVSI